MRWIRQKKHSNLRPEPFSTRVRPGATKALKRYAKSEGVNVTDIIDTKLMRDPAFREHLVAVQKEPHDTSTSNRRQEGGNEEHKQAGGPAEEDPDAA